MPYSTIRPAIFSASLLVAAREVRASRTWTGLADTGHMALIDHRDAAKAGLRVLTDPALWGAHDDLTGPAPMSWPEALELLSAELGEPVTFRVATERQFLELLTSGGVPAGAAELLITREWAILASENDYTIDTFQQITGRPPRPLAEFLHNYRAESDAPATLAIAGAGSSATIASPLERDVLDSITSSMTREEIAALLGSGRLYSPGRDSLYTVDELMAGYESDAPMESLDARLAAHVKACGIPPEDVEEAIAQVVHDQGVDQAMRAYVAASVAEGQHIVGVMGGASTPRDAPAYRLAAATAKAISEAGFLVATGGGLGIMEAGNLGAYFAGRPDDELHAAIDDLKRCPVYRGDEARYFDTARLITAGQRAGARSLAVATWRYDEEPISQFATHIAKLFQNSVREDGLLSIADVGAAYFEGGFGTLREIFQDLAQNSSAPPARQMAMVFVDTAVYGQAGSPFHLARSLAGRAAPPFDDLMTVADSADAVVAAMVAARGRFHPTG